MHRLLAGCHCAAVAQAQTPPATTTIHGIKLGFQMFISVARDRSSHSETEQLQFSIARSRSNLEEAFRLVYQSYIRTGLQSPNDLGLRFIRQHFLRDTEVIIATQSNVIVSTATLIADSDLGLPAEAMYTEEIGAIRDQGLRLAEIGCLADRRDSSARFVEMFSWLSTLLAQTAVNRGYDGVIAATHPRHARFYIRRLGFKQIGGIRECPYVRGNPAVPLLFDFNERRGSDVYNYLFSFPYTATDLAPFEWDEGTKTHFSAIINQLEEIDHKKSASRGLAPTFDLAPIHQNNTHVN